MKARFRTVVFLCVFFVGVLGICHGEIFTWKSREVKGHFTTKDGKTQTVDEFINLTEFHNFVCRLEGSIAPIPIASIKSLTDLGGNRVRVTKKDGEIFTCEIWSNTGDPCMVFTWFMAEITMYVNELHYTFHDVSQDRYSQSRILLCDIETIVFDWDHIPR